MFRPKALATLLCASRFLAAQAPVDLNGLSAAAGRYLSLSLQGQEQPLATDLQMMKGEPAGSPPALMARAADVQRWTLFYNLTPRKVGAGSPSLPVYHSASLKCIGGQFSDFFLSEPPVPNCKSMETTWMAVSLDGAIAQLNAHGYVQGFSQVLVRRPDAAGYPDEQAYIFTCPLERTLVAISANTGAEIWYQMF